MIAFLEKPTESDGFEQIVDFLNVNPIKYALTVSPTIYTSCIKQFWTSAKVKTVNEDIRLQALVDGKKVIVNEASIRRDLRLDDAECTTCLPNAAIFEELERMGQEEKENSWTKEVVQVGLSARVESFKEEEGLCDQEDASKHGRIAEIDANKDLSLFNETVQDQGRMNDEDLFEVNDLDSNEVIVDVTTGENVKQDATVAEKEVSAAADEVVTIVESVKEVMEGSKKTQAEVTEDSSKRAGDEIEQESAKRQRLEKENDTTELKRSFKIVPEDDDDVTIEATPLSSKSPSIVDYKIYKEGKKSYFKIIRADGNSQNYLTFGTMFKNFNREDLDVLRSIVKKRFKKTNPVNDMDNLLFQNLKTMFEHHVEDNIWKY
nr:xylulose kinase-1 [Tanacetum cinerariifolium]